jgi:hypothetical protein
MNLLKPYLFSSRRWNREQKVAAGMGSPVFGYMATAARNNTIKSPAIGTLPYQVSLEDRLRWAQIADVMAQATNHYAVRDQKLHIVKGL